MISKERLKDLLEETESALPESYLYIFRALYLIEAAHCENLVDKLIDLQKKVADLEMKNLSLSAANSKLESTIKQMETSNILRWAENTII